jgi:hypothetical protein
MERAAFGDNSFFHRKETGLPISLATTVDNTNEVDSDDDSSMIGEEEVLELRI